MSTLRLLVVSSERVNCTVEWVGGCVSVCVSGRSSPGQSVRGFALVLSKVYVIAMLIAGSALSIAQFSQGQGWSEGMDGSLSGWMSEGISGKEEGGRGGGIGRWVI